MIVAILSTIALIAVMCRRFELFSAISLLLFSGASISLAYFQCFADSLVLYNVYRNEWVFSQNVSGSLFIQTVSISLYSSIHNLFALQYLRSSLTVPLYYER